MTVAKVMGIDAETSNAKRFYYELDRRSGASISVIAVRTRELERTKSLLHQWASMRDSQFRVWSCLRGWVHYRKLPVKDSTDEDMLPELDVASGDAMRQYLTPSKIDASKIQVFQALEDFELRTRGAAGLNPGANQESLDEPLVGVFMGFHNDILNDPGVQQHIRDHVQRGYHHKDMMVMILTPGTVIPDAIAGEVAVIDLHTPSFSELCDAFDELKGQIPDEFNFEPTDEDRAMIVQNGLGMTLMEFENAIALGIVDFGRALPELKKAKKSITAKDFVKVVRLQKLEVLKQTKILELLPEAKMEDVGGLGNLKEWLELRKVGFTDEARKFGINPPKGFVVVGPPGGGKSLVCKATSHAFGLPLIRFDVSAVFNSLVGSSEARMRMALSMVNEMAPCIVFLDEVDKALSNGGGGGDGGVSQRIFGTLLTWMQERQEKAVPVFVVASANDVTRIPPELLRKGRFDAIWSVSFPSPNERADIFRIHVEKRGHKMSKADYIKLAADTPDFVGAEIESAIEEALYLDYAKGNEEITYESVKECIDKTVPQAKAFPERITQMREWCERNARPASAGDDVVNDTPRPRPGSSLKKVLRRPGSAASARG